MLTCEWERAEESLVVNNIAQTCAERLYWIKRKIYRGDVHSLTLQIYNTNYNDDV